MRILEHNRKFRQIIRAISVSANRDEVSGTMLDREERIKRTSEGLIGPVATGLRLRPGDEAGQRDAEAENPEREKQMPRAARGGVHS
jgi:hypothetical protein